MSCLNKLYNDTNASADIGVVGVSGASGRSPTLLILFRIISWVGGFSVRLRTLSWLSGNKPVTAQAAIIFLFVNALSFARTALLGVERL